MRKMKIIWHAGNVVIDIPWKKPAEADHQTSETKMACSGSTIISNASAYSTSKGSMVEVSSDADGYRGVWYQAKVLKRKGKKSFLVQYQTLLSEDGTEPLVETVNSVFVRPLPPPPSPEADQEFEVNDVVDAFCLDGWWVGVVIKVSNAETCSVFFDDPPDLLVLNRSALRPHWDWVAGHWVRSPKKKVLHGLELQQQLIVDLATFENLCGVEENAVGETANSSTESPMAMELSTRSTENSDMYALTSSGKEIEQASLAVDAAFSHPIKKLKEPCAGTMLFLEPCQLRSLLPCELVISSCATSSLATCSEQQVAYNQNSGKTHGGLVEKKICGGKFPFGSLVIIQQKEVGNVNQKKRKRGMRPNSLVKGNITPEENWSLPFVKHSSILRAIESMEVFQKMPQKPHFHPLDKSKEIYLEGLTIGYMLTFANVAEQTSKLQVCDPTSIFDSMFEALLDLESHGFDVKVVRSCLTELRSIKEKHEQFQEQLVAYRSQILEQMNEQTKIAVELDDVVKGINLLEERKAKLISAKEKNMAEITALKSKVDVVNENIQNAHLDFESVAVGLGD